MISAKALWVQSLGSDLRSSRRKPGPKVRRRRWSRLAAAALALAGGSRLAAAGGPRAQGIELQSAVSAPPSPPAIVKPARWRRGLTLELYGQAYPTRARALMIGGSADLDWVVNLQGFMHACVVTNETPPGLGFGEAAVFVARWARLYPAETAQGPVDGAHFKWRVQWNPRSSGPA